MPVLSSSLDVKSEAFARNRAHMQQLVDDLKAKAALAAAGGTAHQRDRHRARGKLLPRERVDRLIDQGSPFLEVGQLAANGMYGGEVPSAGLIAGVGAVAGRECVIVCNDATVKGGTYYPLTVKKHLRAQEIALENRLPCIYLVDSGGANLPNQDEVFPDREHFGRIFFNQATMSARGIHQIAVVMGSCTAGGAYVPAMADQSIIVRNQGTIFLGGPPLVKAATGEVVSAEDLGGADVHSRTSGVTDYTPSTMSMPSTWRATSCERSITEGPPAAHRANRADRSPIPSSCSASCPADAAARIDVSARSSPASSMRASSTTSSTALYGTTLVCGFAAHPRLSGRHPRQQRHPVQRARGQGAHFIELGCQPAIPLVFLQNITGFMVGRKYEAEGIAKDGANW